jgi:hypothetical protein
MPKLKIFFLPALLVLFLAAVWPTVAHASEPGVQGYPDFVWEVTSLINQHRVQAGCGELQIHPVLTTVAQQHSENMANHAFFSHTDQNGQRLGQRLATAGYPWKGYGENLAGGQPTAAEAVAGWLNSAPHKANMLNCTLHEVGVGYYYLANSSYRTYWTLVMATRPDGTPPIPPIAIVGTEEPEQTPNQDSDSENEYDATGEPEPVPGDRVTTPGFDEDHHLYLPAVQQP